MKPSPFNFVIGQGSWAAEIRYFTTELNPDYWAGFRPVTAEEIATIEREVSRRLPDDFKEFLREFGCGALPEPFGGYISEPEDIISVCHGHLWMILGSADWASEEEQRRLYMTRGAFNPAPTKYTLDALTLEDVNMLDLLQVGTNGLCCYHQVYVGENHGPIGYCLLTPEGLMEDRSASFSEGLKQILTHHWLWNEPPEEESQSPCPPFEMQ